METGLREKVIVVTGASGGIGSAIARMFAQEGALLVLHAHKNLAAAQRLAKELGTERTLVARADLTREQDVRRLFGQVGRRFGRVDTLVANAGSWTSEEALLPQMSLTRWRRIQDAVLTTAFLCLRAFLRCVQRQKQGNAVLIASTAAVFGEAGHADYAAAKAAMAYGLTRTLKNEIARIAPHTRTYCGGRVNCVCPGWTVVPRTAQQLQERATVRRVTATMALKQIARPEDIAAAVVFLSSDLLARHVTGQSLVVAGGMEGRLLWPPHEIDPDIA